MIFQFNWEWISNQMKGICNSEYLLFTNCCIVGDSFFPFLTKNGALSIFFHFFVLFSSFAVFFVCTSQICCFPLHFVPLQAHICARTTKKSQKMRKEQKSEKKMERAPFFVKKRKKNCPHQSNISWIVISIH